MKNIKDKDKEIIDKINKAITELVYEKTTMIKAYNYYHGKRDPEQFAHLEENYGIGSATSVEFVPLVRKHIDVLVGEYLSTPLNPKISCKDSETLSSIFRDKQLKANQEVFNKLKSILENRIYSSIKEQPNDSKIQEEIEDLKEKLDRNFISDYEIAGQNIVDFIIQSRDIDYKNRLKTLLIDLLVSGTIYFKTTESSSKTSFEFKPLNPINTFVERNPNSLYLKNSPRAVSREYLTKHQILSKYGDSLTKDDLDNLDNSSAFSGNGATYYRTSAESTVFSKDSEGILAGYEVTPMLSDTSQYKYNLYPVFEVEWLQADKEKGEYITNRYEGVKIGSSIYLPIGKVDVVRSQNNPKDCSLSINGMFYADRNGDPFSLISSTANLQDKYDMLCFFRDNVIAESGTVGDWIDVAHLPKFLGADVTERLVKWTGYAKSGKKLYDSSQEGDVINTAFNGFDDTVKLQAIQAVELAISRIEDTCSSITGVFRERLGNIEQRDAVSNVQVGIRNSSLITKQYYQTMDLITGESLVDLLNIAKKVYKNGISGTLVLGDRLTKIFTALPEHFTNTDFDIHITDSSEIIKEEETIKMLTMEFAKGGIVDPRVVLSAITSNSLTSMKNNVNNALDKKKKEDDSLGQLSQQVEQLNSELQKQQQSSQQLESKINQLNEEKIQLERDKLQFQKEIGWFKEKANKEYKDKEIVELRKRVELEGLQLIDDNKNNDEIRDK